MACPDARAGQAVALSQLLQRQQRALSGQLLPMLQQGRPTAAALEVFQLAEVEGPSHGPGALLSLPPKLLQSAAAVASGRAWGGLAATTNSNRNSSSMQPVAVVPTSSSSSISSGPCSNPQWVLALAGPEPSSSSMAQGWPNSIGQGDRLPPWQQQQQQAAALQPLKTGSTMYPSPGGSIPQLQQQQQQEAGPWPSSSSSNSGPTPPFASAALTAGTSTSSSAAASGAAGHPCARFLNSDMGRVLGFAAAQLLAHLGGLVAAAGQHHQQGWPLNQNPQQREQQQQQQKDGGVQQQQQQHQAPWRGMRMPWQRGDNAGGSHNAAAHHQPTAAEAAAAWVGKGVVAERDMDLRGALACYQNAVALEPANIEYISRLAKQWSDLTYEEGVTIEQIQEANGKAIEYAERVIAMSPHTSHGYMASCVSRGRLALFSDNKTKVRLAKEAQEAARTALALDPGNDLAHHLMGRWHFEMAQINFVVRQLIKLVYGAALAPGTFQDALSEFQEAVRLNPTKLIHRVELGRTYLRLGNKAEAYQHLATSMELEVEDVNAKLQKEDAELLLTKLRGEFERSVSWGSLAGVGNPAAPAATTTTASTSSSSSSVTAGGAGGAPAS